jgi:predicted dehydrogenase
MKTHPLRLGVLGCANIARAFVRDVAGSAKVRVLAVASRDAAKAAAFAGAFGLARHHGSYEALLADPGIDAVYLPLPNSLHAPWAQLATAAGKHVLCEKPLALSRAEAVAMFDTAREHGVMLLEAYPYWFQPQTRDLIELLAAGAIGTPRTVQASFGFVLSNPAQNIRMKPELGGGALLDAGSYPMSLVRLVMGDAPERVRAEATWSPSGVDMSLEATLHFSGGRRAQLHCAMDEATHRHALIVGTAGVIETEFLNHTGELAQGDAWGRLQSRMRVRRGIANTVPFETVHSATGSGFRFAAEAFADVIAKRDTAAIERAAAASIDIAATLEALASSARQRREVAVQAG